MAIIGLHALIHSKKAEETRAFFRDVLGLQSVDAGGGWLIFAAPPAELAIHPAESDEYFELYLMCDDLAATLAELSAKGVATSEVQELRWGRLSGLALPSGQRLGIYEPKHPTAIGH